MAQAITTQYHAPTRRIGSRIEAKCQAKCIFVEWDDSLAPEENHAIAAMQLAIQLNWHGEWVGGGLPNDRGFAFVQTSIDKSFGAHFKLNKSGGQ